MTPANTDLLRNSASDALDQLQRAATPALKKGKRQARVLLDESGALIDSVGAQVGETANDIVKTLAKYIKSNPKTTFLLALGAGALLISAVTSIQSRR